MSVDDEWVSVAMGDDNLVVDLLLKLNQTGPYPSPAPPPPPPARRKLAALRLDWTVRQRRSASNSKQLHTASRKSCKKEAEPSGARASPTTPLSWSGGCGAATSSAADGFEESSRLLVVRSKQVAVTSETQTTKRSRKKKTLAEVKGEESTLLLEKKSLKNEMATLRLVLEKERVKNENLKRRKLELVRQTGEAAKVAVISELTNSDELRHVQDESGPACSFSPKSNTCSRFKQSLPNTSSHTYNSGGTDSSFSLPDLNLPVDKNPGSDILCGTS